MRSEGLKIGLPFWQETVDAQCLILLDARAI